MTESFDEHGDILRRALRAEADQVMPSMDGLERIRSRTRERKPTGGWAAWFTASWTRPLIAVGAAVVLALLAVSAPPAINHITSLTSDQGSTPHSKSPSGDAPPSDGRSHPAAPGTLPTEPNSQPALPPFSGGPGSPMPCPTTPTPDPSQTATAKRSPTPSSRPDKSPQRGQATTSCPSAPALPSSPPAHPSSVAPSVSVIPPTPADGSLPPAGPQQAAK